MVFISHQTFLASPVTSRTGHCFCIGAINSFFLEYIYIYMEKAMAPHSSILAWKIPWTEEPGRLQSMGSQRVGHD